MSTTKKIPMRKCVGCQEMKNKKEMLRVLKQQKANSFWTQPDVRTGAGHICAFPENVCRKQ